MDDDRRKPRVAEPQRKQGVIRFEMPEDALPPTHGARVLWEVVGTPVEGYMNGSHLSAEVHYDTNDVVARIVPLKGEEEIRTGSVLPQPAR